MPEIDIDTSPSFTERDLYKDLGVSIFGDSSNPIDQKDLQNKLRVYASENGGKTLYDLNISGDLKTQFDDQGNIFSRSIGIESGQSLFHSKNNINKALMSFGNTGLGTDVDDIKNYINYSNLGRPVVAINQGDVSFEVDNEIFTQSSLRDEIADFKVDNPDYNTKKYPRYEKLIKALEKQGGEGFYSLDASTMQELYIADNKPQYDPTKLRNEANFAFARGVNFLDKDRILFMTAEYKLRTGDYEENEKADLEKIIKEGNKKYGDKTIYDVETGSLSNEELEMRDQQVIGAATELSSKVTDFDELKTMLLQKKDRIVVLADVALKLYENQIKQFDQMKKDGQNLTLTNFGIGGVSADVSMGDQSLLYDAKDFRESQFLTDPTAKLEAEKQINYLKQIVETGQIPETTELNTVSDLRLGIGSALFVKNKNDKKLGYLLGDSKIVRLFNQAMNEYDINNKALQINRDFLSSEKIGGLKGFGKTMFGRLVEDFGFRRDKFNSEERQIFADGLEEAGVIVRNANGDYTPEFEELLETTRGEDLGGRTYDLSKILMEFYVIRTAAGKKINAAASAFETGVINAAKNSKFALLRNTSNFLQKTVKGTTFGRAGSGGLITAVGDEALLFEGANALGTSLSGGKTPYEFGEGLKFGGTLSLFGGAWRGMSKSFSQNILARSPIAADMSYKVFRSNPMVSNFTDKFVGAVGGAWGLTTSNFLTNPEEAFKDFSVSNYLTDWMDETMVLVVSQKISGSLTNPKGVNFTSLRNQFVETTRKIRGKDPKVIEVSANNLELPSDITSKENAEQTILDAANKKVKEVNDRLKKDEITAKEAVNEINNISKDALVLTNQTKLKNLKDIINNDPSLPSEGQIYYAVKQWQSQSPLNQANSKIISELGPEYLLEKLNLDINPTNINLANKIIYREKHIQSLLNGGGIMFGFEGPEIVGEGRFRAQTLELREKTYKFLRERLSLEDQLQQLQGKSKKGLKETEKNQLEADIKRVQEELKRYEEGGEKYEANQKELDKDFETALAKEKAKDKDITITTSQGESRGKFIDATEFKKIVENDGVEYNERSLAYTAKDGNRYINEAAIRKVRKISDPFHERNHTYFLDLILKDSNGLVTKEGMETIDSILETLTPSERTKLDAEVESRYDTSKPKEQWYEENIAVMGELMSGKNPVIKRSKSFTESLKGLLPLAKNRGFENIGDTPTELAGLIASAARGSEGAEKRLGEIAETRALELEATKEATGEKPTETASGKPSLSRVVSKEAKELQELLDNRSLVESLKSRSTEDKFSVAQAFVEKNFGLVKDLFNVKSQAEENALKEILEEQILGEFPGSGNGKYSARNTNLFNSYDAAKESGGAKETTYFRNVLSKRIPEIDVALKERTGTSSELPDQTREFAPEPTTEKAKPTASKQLPSEVKMKPEFIENLGIEVKEGQTPEQAIQEALKTQVLDSFKDVDIKKYKDLKTPRALAEFYAKMLGIKSEAGIKALMIPNRNFPAGEKAAATRAKQFILDNLQAIHSRINTPGFKQTKVGKALLTEKGDLKPGSLKILKDIISGKNITVEGYDGKPIEFNPLENGKPVPLYRRSQPLKVVLSSYFKNNALEYLEGDAGQRAKLGAKFSNAKDVEKTLKLSERRRLEKELKTIGGKLRTIARNVLPEGVELPDLSTIEGRQGYVDFLTTDYFPKVIEKFGANTTAITKPTDVSPGGNRINYTKDGKKFSGALNESQLGVTNATDPKLVGKYGEKFAKENKELADAGLVFEQKNIKELIPEGDIDVDIEVATRQQKTKDLQRNLDSRQQHINGYKKVLNNFKEVFDSDPKMMQGLIFHMYNPNANYSFYRNFAQLIGKEVGINKGREEHVYQAGRWAVRTLEAMTSANPKTWDNWLDWSSENYYQETLGPDAHKAVDGRYKENRYSDVNPAPAWLPKFKLDGVYYGVSMEHPLLEKSINESI